MRPFSFVLAGLLATASLPVLAQTESHWRLFVADHAEPKIAVIDLNAGEVLEDFAVEGPASLYATGSKAGVFGVQGSADSVAAIRSGIALEDHGDHGDIAVEAPALVPARVTGDKPSHFVEHHGQIALFFDEEGMVRVLDESAWLEGKPQAREYKVAAPHHGLAVQMGDYLLVSASNPDDPDKRRTGMLVIDAQGQQVGELHDCPDLHGEATSGNLLAVGCATGLLIAKEAATGPVVEFLPYSESLPEGKTTTLLGGVGLQYFLGNYGADRVVLIDPSAEDDSFRLVDLPTRRVHFAVNPGTPKFAYVFTEDGQLRELDVVSGELTRSLQLTQPYSMDGEWDLPRPRIAVAGGDIAVTDPLAGTIHIVDAADFQKEREIALEGAPFNIVAVGGSGHTH